jgi:hypothetical protein
VHQLLCGVLVLIAGGLQPQSAPRTVCDVPIQYREGLLWVEVNSPKQNEPLLFLVDSGASVSVINLATARRLHLNLGGKVGVAAVGKKVTGHWPVRMPATLGAITLPDEYLAIDLRKLSSACEREVDGLIGADFFRGKVVQIDYAAEKLRLLDVPPSPSATVAVPLQSRPCGFRVAINVNGGKSQSVRVDTGCASAFQWATAESVEQCASKPAVGLTELLIQQTTTTVCIGTRCVESVPTGLHKTTIFPGESGLLGNAFLARFGTITFDAKSGLLLLGSMQMR